MKGEDQLYQQIESYLKGELVGEEKAAFEQKLATDPELQRKVELSKLADKLVIENRLLQVKELLKETHNNAGKSNFGRNILLGVVGLLIVGGAALFVALNKEDKKETSVTITKAETNATLPASESKNQVTTTKSTIKTGAGNIKNTAPVQNSNPIVEVRKIGADTTTTSQQHSVPDKGIHETTESIHQNPLQPTTPANPCEGVNIKAKVTTTIPCEGEENGSVTITDIKNGTAPYNILLKDKSGKDIYSYHNLPSGNYSVDITDSRGCHRELTGITLSEKKCSKDYVFDPNAGEVWQIPISENSGTLSILDKSGNVYLQKQLNAGTQETWDGYSQHGELKIGYFIFTINYNNGTTVTGSVTVIK